MCLFNARNTSIIKYIIYFPSSSFFLFIYSRSCSCCARCAFSQKCAGVFSITKVIASCVVLRHWRVPQPVNARADAPVIP